MDFSPQDYKECEGKIGWNGGVGWNLKISGGEWYLSDVPVLRNWYETVKFIRKFIYMQFCIKVVVLNRSYSTNMQPI